MKALDIIHKQIAHISVVIIELIKGLISDKNETEVARQKKRNFLLNTAVKVCQWVNNFDPQNINYDSLKLPTNLKKLNQYAEDLVHKWPQVDLTADIVFSKDKYRADRDDLLS